jgi:hypothetical protein
LDGWLTTSNGIKANERIDFEISEMEVDINGIEADEEVDEGILLGSWDGRKERLCHLFTRGELGTNGDLETGSFSIDIANIDTTFVSEKNFVALSLGVDANVVFGVGGMREEGLYDEVVEGASDGLNLVDPRLFGVIAEISVSQWTRLDGFSSSFADPLLAFLPAFVERQKARFTTPFDQLVGFRHEFFAKDPGWKLVIGGDRVCLRVPCYLGDLWDRKDEVGFEGCGFRDGGCARQPVRQKEFSIVLSDRCRRCT